MLDNATRRQLLNRHKSSGFPGSIIDVYNAYNQGIDLISQFEMSNQPQMQVANTPQQQQEGLRPFHQQGQTNQSMAFPNVPPNTNFNTVGMKAPINIKKIDNQGNLVKSYENVPPGIQSLPTGPVGGTVIETPANMQSGGVKSDSKAVRSSQWPPELDFLDQEERFRRSLTGNVLPPAEVIGHRSIPEKNRRVDEKAHYADGTMNVDKFIAMGKLTGWKPWIMDIVHNGYSGHDRTAQDENVIEFFDGTGISSWDDAARAYIDWEVSDRTFPTFIEAGNILSAFPAANIIKGAKFGLTKFQKLNNRYARTIKGNNYINAAEDARQELIESKSNKKYGGLLRSGGVRKYQSGAKIDPFSPRAIAQQMADRFGGTADTYLALGDTVAYHESAHTMNPKMRQYDGGPGRGAFQIEPASMERLQNRVKAYANQHGYQVPSWINVPNNDARNLTLDQQMSLFLLDMAASSGTNMRAYAEGRSTTQEQWLKGWKRKPSQDGLDYQRFRTSANKAKAQGIPNASAMPSNIPPRITTRASATPKPGPRGVIEYDPSKLTLGSIIRLQ